MDMMQLEKFIYPSKQRNSEQEQKKYREAEYVMLDYGITVILYSDILHLIMEKTGQNIQFQKEIVEVGRDKNSDLLLEGKNMVARRQATFFYEKQIWFLRDNFSTNGTWINGRKMQPGKKYQLAAGDEINFAMAETVIFEKRIDKTVQPMKISEERVLELMERGIEGVAESNGEDKLAMKLVLSAMLYAPLYLPVDVDVADMFSSVDIEKLQAGDILQAKEGIRMRIRTFAIKNSVEFIPVFTSREEANRGESTSIVRLYPENYIPMLRDMNKPVGINMFSENGFIMNSQLVKNLALLLKTGIDSGSDIARWLADNLVGRSIAEKYEIVKMIGQGGLHTTYLVKNLHNNGFGVIKVCNKWNGYGGFEYEETIFTEGKVIKKLNHPGIPKLLDFVEDGEDSFIIKEYVEGKSLEEIVKKQGAQSTDRVVDWAKQLCNVLTYLHSQTTPYIYRDMKPSNVILQPDGKVKIIDFGAVRTYKMNQKEDTCCLGSKGYAAPEQFGGKQTDARTDIFGLGMTMFRLITGVNPVEPPYEVKPIRQINPELPRGMEYIISKCTQPDPDKRYQSCDELINDLDNYSSLNKPKGLFGKLFGRK